MTPAAASPIRAFVVWVLCLLGAVLLADAAIAQPDELSGRVGRIADVQGKAWIHDDEQGRWVEAWRNAALTAGDRLSVERGGRLQAGIGSTELRLDGDTEVEFERLDDQRISVRVHSGRLAVRVRSREVAREVEILAGTVRGWPDRVGHYRIEREDGVSSWTVWRGSLGVDTRDQRITVEAGRSVDLYREGRDATVVTWGAVAQDAFSDWVARDEDRDDRRVESSRYVSPEMTGADELDRHGRWERHPEWGMVWYPLSIAADWAPYRHGRWIWRVRWGWTWIDDAPWGFASSHYGRWAHWRGRWVWVPGSYVARPVFAPALVAWVGGGSGVSVSVSVGHGAVGWLPLSPWDTYVPPFRYPHRYFDRVNLPHRRPGVPPQVPTGPISYGNQGVPNAVTVVPSHVLQQRQPVAPAWVHEPEAHRRPPREGFQPQFPVTAPGVATPRAVPVPGGGEPSGRPALPGRDHGRGAPPEGERRRITVPGVSVPPAVVTQTPAAPHVPVAPAPVAPIAGPQPSVPATAPGLPAPAARDVAPGRPAPPVRQVGVPVTPARPSPPTATEPRARPPEAARVDERRESPRESTRELARDNMRQRQERQ